MLQKAIRGQKVRAVGESEAGGFGQKIGGQSLWNLELGGVKSFGIAQTCDARTIPACGDGSPRGVGNPARFSSNLQDRKRRFILCGGNNEATESHAWKVWGTHLRGDSHQPHHLWRSDGFLIGGLSSLACTLNYDNYI